MVYFRRISLRINIEVENKECTLESNLCAKPRLKRRQNSKKINNMETFVASRLSEGNKTFPIKIVIDEIGITLKHPGIFSGKEQTVPFSRISSVDVDSPLVGYSTIIIHATGQGKIEAHGFTKAEVNQMRKVILDKI